MYEVNVKGFAVTEYGEYEKTLLFAFVNNAMSYAKKVAVASDVEEVVVTDGFTGEVLWMN